MRDAMLKAGFLGFMGGVLLRSFVYVSDAELVWVYMLIVVFLLGWAVFRQSRVLVVSFFIFCFALGVIRYGGAEFKPSPGMDQFVGKDVVVEGMVSEEADVRDTHTNVVVDIDTLLKGDVYKKVHTRVFVSVSSYPVYRYGDRIELKGVLEVPKNFTNDTTGKTFDYVHYLTKDGIGYAMYYPYVSLVAHGQGSKIKEALYGVKHGFLESLSRVVPDPEGALGAGVLLGGKQSLGAELLDAFRTAGVVHIVVLSGYNVTIVAESLMRIFAFLPRGFALALGSGSIALFALMVGAGATVVRASVMALLVVLARTLGKGYRMDRALYFAGFVMVFISPSILAFDPSFQLSFMATAGILYFAPILEKRAQFISEKWGMRSIVASTIATQIFVLPLLIYETGKFSLVGLPANLFVLPVIPLAMLASLLAGLAGIVGGVIAFPFAFVAYIVLLYIIQVTTFFAGLPLAAVTVTYMPFAFVVAMYMFYAVGLRYTKARGRKAIAQ